jgi:hypothetical protein
VKILLAGVLAAVLVAAPAAARTGGAAGGSIELCGPAGCASTSDSAGVAQFQAFVGPITEPSTLPPFPPAVRPYYRATGPGLRSPALYLPGSGQIGLKFRGSPVADWYALGPYSNAALRKIAKSLRPFPAPRPATVLVNGKKVRDTAIYSHMYDNFPEPAAVAASTKPWVSVQVKWPHGTAWPDLAFTVRRGTRVMLRSDHAVQISKALAARILADSKR